MGPGPSKLRFLSVVLLIAAGIAVAAVLVMEFVFNASVSPTRTIITSVIVAAFLSLLILARQDRDGFTVERTEEGPPAAKGFDSEGVAHETPDSKAAPPPKDAAKEEDKPKGAPTRRY